MVATRGAIFSPGGARAVTSERDATSHYVRARSATSVDVLEQGASGQRSARRLFMQLHVFTSCTDVKPVVRALAASRIEAVLYHDLNDPRGIGVLAMEEDPGFVVNDLRALLNAEPFAELPYRTEFTMFGRTYAPGFKPDSRGLAAAPSAAPCARSGPAVGGLVSAPAARCLCPAVDRGAASDRSGARRPGTGLRGGGPGARHPSRLPRAGRWRQRLRHRPRGPGAPPAQPARPGDAQDRPDCAVLGAPGSVFCRPRGVAERHPG